MKQIIILALTLLATTGWLSSCKKESKHQAHEDIIQFFLVKSHVLPQEIVYLTVDQPVDKDSISARISDQAVMIRKLDSVTYFFFIPVLPAGVHTIKIEAVNANDLTITMDPYVPITDAEQELRVQASRYNQLIDSLQNNHFRNAITSDDISFLHQLVAQIEKNAQECSLAEKAALAYQMRIFVPLNILQEPVDSAYLSAKITQAKTDPSDMLWTKAKSTAFWVSSSILMARATGASVRVITTPFGVGSFLASLVACVYSLKQTFNCLSEFGKILGVASSLDPDPNGSGSNANPIIVVRDESISYEVNANFRTVKSSDADMSNEDISAAIKGANLLQEEDGKLKKIFNTVKSTFSNWFGEIKTEYPNFLSPISSSSSFKTLPAFSKNISIDNVSNSRINVEVHDDGNNKLQIIASNPDNSIKANTPFSAKVVYNQANIENVVSALYEFVYKPSNVLAILTTSKVTIIIDTTQIESGGTIISDGGSNVTDRGICWSTSHDPTVSDYRKGEGAGIGYFSSRTTNFLHNTQYYLRAYATNGNGTSYGNEVEFYVNSIPCPCSVVLNHRGEPGSYHTTFSDISRTYNIVDSQGTISMPPCTGVTSSPATVKRSFLLRPNSDIEFYFSVDPYTYGSCNYSGFSETHKFNCR